MTILDFKLTALESENLEFKLTAIESENLDFELSSLGKEGEEGGAIFDKDFRITVEDHQISVADAALYGSALEVTLDAGAYVVTAVSGACEDSDTVPDLWAWHVRSSKFDLVDGFSLLANSYGYGWAGSAAEALSSVRGLSIDFYWGGGTFEMWLPTNDVIEPNNNSGSCTLNIKSV